MRYPLAPALQVFDQIVERVAVRFGLGDVAVCQLAQVLFVILPGADFDPSSGDKRSDPSARFYYSGPLQLGVDLGHRIGINAEINS